MLPNIPFKIRLKWIFDKSNRSGIVSRLRVLLGGYTPTLIIYYNDYLYLDSIKEAFFEEVMTDDK